MITLAVESRVVAYEEGKELPHVFASVSTPLEVAQPLNNSPETINTFCEAINNNMVDLGEAFEDTFNETKPHDLLQKTYGMNVLDVQALLAIANAVAEGKARILASHITQRSSEDPAWYCIKVKKG